jgi:hypothetical protein
LPSPLDLPATGIGRSRRPSGRLAHHALVRLAPEPALTLSELAVAVGRTLSPVRLPLARARFLEAPKSVTSFSPTYAVYGSDEDLVIELDAGLRPTVVDDVQTTIAPEPTEPAPRGRTRWTWPVVAGRTYEVECG